MDTISGTVRIGVQKHPTGPSHTRDICPPGETLGAFEDNTAHSNVRYGLRIFNFWVPIEPGRDTCGWDRWWVQKYPSTATLLRYTGYKNGRTGLMMSRAGDVRCVGCSLIDNMRAGAELNRMDAPYGTTGTYDTIIGVNSPAMAGRSFPHSARDDPDSPRTYGWIVSGFTNEQVVANTTFWGFTGENVYAFSTCDHCNFPNSKNQGAKTTHFANITYNNTDNFVFYGSRLNAILHDMDGTLSGYPSGTYMTHSGWPHLIPSCPIGDRPGWNTSVVCPMNKRLIRLMVDKPKPFSIYQDRRMVVQHGLPPAIGTLRPLNKNQDGTSRSMADKWDQCRNKKLKENPNGWAVVVASDEHYHVWINATNSVSENLRFEATDMMPSSRSNASAPETVVVTLPYDDVWPYIGVDGPGGEAEATDRALVDGRADNLNTGDSYRNYDSNTLSLLFSGRDNPDRGWWWNQRVQAYGARCPPEGCPLPEAVTVDRSEPWRRWGDRAMWESLPVDARPRLDPATGLPAAGADVRIPAEWRIELDSDTQPLGHLELDGLLVFPRGRDAVLSFETLKMSVGEIQAGTASRPHDGKVTLRIVDSGQRTSARTPARRLSTVGGSNVLEVLGAIKLHGTSSQPQATHLAAPAAPGDTAITLTDAAQWRPGEEIFLTSTGHSWQAVEYATVASCSGTAVTLQGPLRHAHFGAGDMFRDAAIGNATKFEGLENRAQVLLLSRSITIEGGGGERDGRGAKLLVSELEVQREERGIPITTVYRGSLDVSNVAFRGMGQADTGRAAVTILTTAGNVSIHGCTVSHCHGPGIDVRSAAAVNMTSNTVLDTQGPAVAIWNDARSAGGVQVPPAPRVVLVNNTAGFARKLGVDVVKDSVSGFVLCPFSTQCVVQAEGNVAAGSENYGFVIGRASTCGVNDTADVANTAHSCRVGFLYLAPAARRCSRVSNAIAHHATEVGVVYDRGGLSLEVEHLLLSDNRLGLAAMPGSKRAISSGSVAVNRSAAIGFSNNGGCGADATITCPRSCGRAGGLPNYSEGGDAQCGPRIGFTTSVWFNKPKVWPRQPPIMGPWWSVDGDASLGGYTTFHDIALIGWPERDDCGCRHFGITPNPSSDDLMPTAFVSGVHKSNVSAGAEYYTPPADPSRATFDNCVDFECTGLSHAVLVDADGSLVGAPASITRGDGNLSIGDSRRYYEPRMDAYIIPGGSYRELYFESLDPDRMSRRVQPVSVTGVGAAADRTSVARLNCFEDHLWDFDYTSLLRLSRFAMTVELGGVYTITYAGTPPQMKQISMSGIAEDEGVLVRLKYSVAQTFKVQVKGQRMLLPSLVPVTLTDPAGSNYWSMDTFELTVVVKGPRPLLVRQLPMVRISMALQMDVQTFLDTPTSTFTTGLANTLQLEPTTIRVTGYASRGNRRRRLTQGGIDLTFAVIPAAELEDDVTPDADVDGDGDVGEEEVEEVDEVAVFDAASVRELAAAVAVATAAVEEFEIAGVTVATSSLVTEVQEPVAQDCVPTCKTADNGVAPTCTTAVCVCPSDAYTYYDATLDGLNANRSSGCYEVVDPDTADDSPSTPPAGTVSRQAVLVTVRFTEMTLDQVTEEFKAALCEVSKGRIAAVMAASGSADVLLGCSVTTTNGSVIASAQIVVPAGIGGDVVTAAASDLTANLGADISANAVLAAFGAFDAPTATVGSVDVTAMLLVPVIADEVALQPSGEMLARQDGPSVAVEVTFTQTLPNGTVTAVDVSGFTADDVVASVTTLTDARVLLVVASVAPVSGSWYRLRLAPGAWAEADLRSCELWTLAVGIAEGAAVSAGGDVSQASATVSLRWRPAADDLCAVEADVDRGGTLLAAVLGGVFGAVLLSAIVGIVFARRQCHRARVGFDNPHII